MSLLFSYGTLQLADIQLATFGRMLRGERDEVVGCERETIGEHANLRFNGNPNARVAGTVLEVTDAELAEADKYERLAQYGRREVTLASGRTAWAYVHAP